MNNDFVKSKTLLLSEIFNFGMNCFEIPDYQRAYSWEKKERKDFIIDIENILEGQNYKHFMGTIVSQDKGFINGQHFFDIIDGQQRLTTIITLLSVLTQCNFVDKNISDEINNNYIFKGKDKGNTIRIYKLNGELDKYFHRKLEQWDYTSEEHNTKAHVNIDNSFKEFKYWIDEKIKKDVSFPEKIYSALSKKIGFLFHIPETESEVGLMFEIINNRGKRLSELEKIKNYFIYYSAKSGYRDINVAVLDYWGKILFNLNACGQTSNEDENSFLRNTWIVFEDTNKSESYHVYDNLKIRFPAKADSNWQRLKKYIEFVDESAETYNKVLTRNLIADPEEKKIVEQIFFQQSTGSIFPLVLSVYSKIKNSKKRCELLSIIEKLNFRYYGCGIANRSDTGNGYLFGLANNFFNENHSEEWLKINLKEFINKNCNDETIVKSLTLTKEESQDFYDWNNLKYFLANYEESIAVLNGGIEDFTRFLLPQDILNKNANFEKEHIIATAECSAITEPNDVNKRRLGNFALLIPSVNKSIKDKPLYDKLFEYKNNADKYLTPRSLSELEKLYGIENVQQREKIYTSDFIIRFLDKREEKLLNFALKRWGFEDSKNVKIDSTSGESKIYHLDFEKNN